MQAMVFVSDHDVSALRQCVSETKGKSHRKLRRPGAHKLKPRMKMATPEPIKNSPMKSNSLRCWRKGFLGTGLVWRKKKRIAAATPPVGKLTNCASALASVCMRVVG